MCISTQITDYSDNK